MQKQQHDLASSVNYLHQYSLEREREENNESLIRGGGTRSRLLLIGCSVRNPEVRQIIIPNSDVPRKVQIDERQWEEQDGAYDRDESDQLHTMLVLCGDHKGR